LLNDVGGRHVGEQEVRAALDSHPVQLALDLGCNDGTYARIAAERADYVVAVDADDVVVNALYRALRGDGTTNVLPLVMNLIDPTPARGWRGTERQAFPDRGDPDLVLGLALVHHLAIGANVPLSQVVEWLRAFGACVIVEFVEPRDPMVQRLLANKPPGLFADYRIDRFESLLGRHFAVERREALPTGSRILYLATPQ